MSEQENSINNSSDEFAEENSASSQDASQLNAIEPLNNAGKTAKYWVIGAVVLGLAVMIANNYIQNFMHPKNTSEKANTKKFEAAPADISKYKPPEPPVEKKTEPQPQPEPEEVPEPEPVLVVEEPAPEPPAPPPEPKEEPPKKPSLQERRLASNIGSSAKSQTEPQKFKGRYLDNADFILMKGTKIPCVLESNVVSEQDGFVSCIVHRDVYSGNAKVLLVEKGSRITGEYSGNIKNGDKRLQIIWDRIVTPYNIIIDLNSPTTDRLGASGVTGKVDNRWGLRIGSALLVSIIDDALSIAKDNNSDNNNANTKVVVDGETTSTTQNIAEKILEKNLDLNPIIYLQEGKILNIYAAEDIDLSNVYKIYRRRTSYIQDERHLSSK